MPPSVDSSEGADEIFQRVKEYLPVEFEGYELVSLNERLRYLRYHPGQFFNTHMDGSYTRENGETSFITLQLYLNTVEQGGATTFLSPDERIAVDVNPKPGAVLIFQHNILHRGSEVKAVRLFVCAFDLTHCALVLVCMCFGCVSLVRLCSLSPTPLSRQGEKYALRTDVMYRPKK